MERYESYDQWKDVVTLRRPLIYKEVNTPYEVVDELLPKQKQRPLNFKNLLCVARKPTVSAMPLTTRGNAVLIDLTRTHSILRQRGTLRAGGMCQCWQCQRVYLPQMPEDLPGGHAHLFGVRPVFGHHVHVRHAPSLSSFQAGRAC